MLRARQSDAEAAILELERRRSDALASLRRDTGRQITEVELRDRLDERLRELVRPVVEQVLAERAATSDPSRESSTRDAAPA